MAVSSANEGFTIQNLNYFPPVENGHINITKFIRASTDLLSITDCLGKLFTPVKLDMQGNIEKIKTNFIFNESTCLLDLILKEAADGGHIGGEATLWLNRALLFFELTFIEILNNLNQKNLDINMKVIFTKAYEGSVKKYHNWAIQQLFMVICKLSPTFSQMMSSTGLGNVDIFQEKMTEFNDSLHVVRCSIDQFFIDNGLYYDA